METPREEKVKQSSQKLTPKMVMPTRIFSLQQQLLFSLIPALIIPLLLATIFGYNLIKKNTEQEFKAKLNNSVLLTQEALLSSLQDTETIPFLLANNPGISQKIKSTHQLIIQENLAAFSIEELEEKFAQNKLIKEDLELNNYLQSAVTNSPFSEIFITDKLGFNVGYSNLTSDLVQRDEAWWQNARSGDKFLSEPEFDASSNVFSLSISQAIKDPKSQEFLGVIKAVLPIAYLSQKAEIYLEQIGIASSETVQIIDSQGENAVTTISLEDDTSQQEIIGGSEITQLSQAIYEIGQQNNSLAAIADLLPQDLGINNVEVAEFTPEARTATFTVSFVHRDRKYSLTPIPKTPFVVAASIAIADTNAVANNLVSAFLGVTAILLLIISLAVILLARQIAAPLQNLAIKAEEVAAGNIEVTAKLEGSTEMITLANSFNNLLRKVIDSIQQQDIALQNAEAVSKEAERIAREQQTKNARVQQELLNLLEDVEGASQGDLTVRSQINDGEIGIVADFFNSIIESLREIVAQVKTGTEKVNISVDENKTTINQLALEASQQAEQITQTLLSVENITQSIQQVSLNAQEAAKVARIASSKAKLGGEGMELTVNSIQQLRGTIGKTADKVKVLGEASQQISRVISLINQIAMQTNLLAINASIEAARAGEEGKGFAVVAEEVGELATQSSEATKEVGTIIAGIQKEILQVVEAMEIGLAQAEEGTNLVENTKESLEQIVTVSYKIDNLVQAISETTVSQAETSQTVTQLMEQIAEVSTKTSQFSQSAYSSLESTVAIAQELQSSVGTFKVDRED